MEARFDNKNNVLNAQIRALHDNTVIYTIATTFNWSGRKLTVLRDVNPAPGDEDYTVVGAIHWQDKLIEVNGQKKKFADVKRRGGWSMFHRTRNWCWGPDRKDYEVTHHHDEWKASLNNNMMIAARFSVPFRPHLFSKPKPTMLHLTQTALKEDEIFLILVFIYSEAKRQEETNCSVGAGSEGW